MARLPLIDPAATSGDVRASFDRMPVVLNIFRMMAHAEANFIPAMRFANSILHRQKLSHVNRELLILQVAQRQHGAYEWRQHVPIALGVGVTQKQIDCVEQDKYKDDAFSASLNDLEAFQVDYQDKNLRVKLRKGKQFNFTDPDGNADRLFVFHRDVEKARERLAP